MITARSLVFAFAFFWATVGHVLAALIVAPFSERALQRVVLGWSQSHAWLAGTLVGIDSRVDGTVPAGAYLLAVKHESMFETLETIRLLGKPIVVLKRELAYIPLFGKVTRLYGVIPVDRAAGATALRGMVAEGKKAVAARRAVAIFPEGTRVERGQSPALRPGFAGLYRMLGLPVVPIAVDSGRFWSRRGLALRSGTVTFRVGEIIPPGLAREDVERRVHAAINLLNSAA